MRCGAVRCLLLLSVLAVFVSGSVPVSVISRALAWLVVSGLRFLRRVSPFSTLFPSGALRERYIRVVGETG